MLFSFFGFDSIQTTPSRLKHDLIPVLYQFRYHKKVKQNKQKRIAEIGRQIITAPIFDDDVQQQLGGSTINAVIPTIIMLQHWAYHQTLFPALLQCVS